MCIFLYIQILMFLLVLICKKQTQKMQNKYIFCILLLWGIVFGLRSFDCGNDTYMYHRFFSGEYISGLGTYMIDSDSEEIGFTIVANLLHRISDETTFFFLTTAIAAFLVIYPFYRNNSTGLWNLLCFFIMSASFSSYIIAMRQSISMILIFLGIYFFKLFFDSQSRSDERTKKKQPFKITQIWRNRNLLIGVCLCFFAIFVHRTTILLLPLLLIVNFLKFNRTTATITIVTVFVLSLSFTSTIGHFFDVILAYVGGLSNDNVNLLAERYENNFGSSSITTLKLLSWCVPMLVTARVSSETRMKSFQFTCLMIGFILYILLGSSTMCIRISMMFQLIGFAMFVPEEVNKNKKLYWIYIVFTILFFYSAYQNYERWIVSPYDSTLPFLFFWE